MMVAVSRDFVPGVKEVRAAIRASNMPPGIGRTLEMRTVVTGIIALAVIVWTGVLLYSRVAIPSGWWGLVTGIGIFYFVDPKTLVASTLDNIRREAATNPQKAGGIE